MVEAQTFEKLSALASALETGLKKNEIQSIVTLLQNGVPPEALAALILEMKNSRK